MKPIDADYFVEFLGDLYEQAGWNDREIHMSLWDVICNLDNIPTLTDIYHWTPVEDGLPDESGEYVVTLEQKYTYKKEVISRFVTKAYFAQNLMAFAPHDFPDKNRPGWCEYNREDAEYYDLDWDAIGIRQRVIAWTPCPKPYGKEN